MVEAARRKQPRGAGRHAAAVGRALPARGEIRPGGPHRRRLLRHLLEPLAAPPTPRPPVTGGPPPGMDWDLWLGPAPKLPYEEVMNVGRRGYWEFCGGMLTEWGAHLADIVLWAMKARRPETRGGRRAARSTARKGEIPDTLQVTYTYPELPLPLLGPAPQHLRPERRRRARPASAATASSSTAPRARCSSTAAASASRRSRCARRSPTSRRRCRPPTAGSPGFYYTTEILPEMSDSSAAARAARAQLPRLREEPQAAQRRHRGRATTPTRSAGWATSPTGWAARCAGTRPRSRSSATPRPTGWRSGTYRDPWKPKGSDR